MKIPFLFLIGVGLLLSGITLILLWWPDCVQLFRSGIGMVLAVVGLFILYNIKK